MLGSEHIARILAISQKAQERRAQRRKSGLIRLRAIAQIGKLSRELEKAQFVPGKGSCPATGGRTKEEQLDAAGLKERTANRYEELTAPDPKIGLTGETQLDKVDQLKAAGLSKAAAGQRRLDRPCPAWYSRTTAACAI